MKESTMSSVDAPEFGAKVRGKSLTVSVDDIHANKWNYNTQSDFIYEKMKQSISRFGFVEPIVCRSSNDKGALGFYEIIGGEHRLKAAKELGFNKIPIIDIGALPDATAQKLMIVLNETKGRPDQDQLAAIISQLDSAGVDLDELPFDKAELESFVSMGDFDWNDVDSGKGSGSVDDGGDDYPEERHQYWVSHFTSLHSGLR